ncbi:hypothetical protein SAMN05661080_04599 [Modestobacter sp. DSM 44400]|uniref:hypothetical protein n=1 Tax=Modestobacter sp. DSM 44400 TaxID=1550230 RepID=UPI00089C14C5|nr:hypothetical protein [Modestobacter sp. DSM 44400]SDY78445.1 hypothetical protein SAMN05661080_04599 [Modestobacter sp. DSM 44400]
MRLLVVTDGTCPAEQLRPVLALLARPTRVTLLAVADTPTGGLGPPHDVLDPAPTPPPPAYTDRLTALAISDGDFACQQQHGLVEVDVEMASQCGDLAGLLAAELSRRGADLVVLADWRARPRLRSAAVSTVAGDAGRPVLLVP